MFDQIEGVRIAIRSLLVKASLFQVSTSGLILLLISQALEPPVISTAKFSSIYPLLGNGLPSIQEMRDFLSPESASCDPSLEV